MTEFDRRWQVCARRAREASEEPIRMPYGFAARVIRPVAPVFSLASAWEWFGWRLLTGATALLVVCACLEWPAMRASQRLLPPVEDTVAQAFWML